MRAAMAPWSSPTLRSSNVATWEISYNMEVFIRKTACNGGFSSKPCLITRGHSPLKLVLEDESTYHQPLWLLGHLR